MKTKDLQLEGTWEEIQSHVPEFNGKRLRVTVHVSEDDNVVPISCINDALAKIWQSVPDSSWQSLPSDLGDNLDHYIYNTPKST